MNLLLLFFRCHSYLVIPRKNIENEQNLYLYFLLVSCFGEKCLVFLTYNNLMIISRPNEDRKRTAIRMLSINVLKWKKHANDNWMTDGFQFSICQPSCLCLKHQHEKKNLLFFLQMFETMKTIKWTHKQFCRNIEFKLRINHVNINAFRFCTLNAEIEHHFNHNMKVHKEQRKTNMNDLLATIFKICSVRANKVFTLEMETLNNFDHFWHYFYAYTWWSNGK